MPYLGPAFAGGSKKPKMTIEEYQRKLLPLYIQLSILDSANKEFNIDELEKGSLASLFPKFR
jgi:hypothetical protein